MKKAVTIIMTTVSIPYGKGKVEKAKYSTLSLEYQFPMGKVKTNLILFAEEIDILYQFPMGKVKPVIPLSWHPEAIVSIPYGKGKEQHFVLHFKYTP